MVFQVPEGVLAEDTVALAAQWSREHLYQLDIARAYALIAGYLAVKGSVLKAFLTLEEKMGRNIFLCIVTHV